MTKYSVFIDILDSVAKISRKRKSLDPMGKTGQRRVGNKVEEQTTPVSIMSLYLQPAGKS